MNTFIPKYSHNFPQVLLVSLIFILAASCQSPLSEESVLTTQTEARASKLVIASGLDITDFGWTVITRRVRMKNELKRMEDLRSEVFEAKAHILSMSNKLPIHGDLLNILTEMDEYLTSGNLDKEKMEKYSFGLFRLTTENYTVEKSDLGERLLNLQKNTRSFIHDFYEAA